MNLFSIKPKINLAFTIKGCYLYLNANTYINQVSSEIRPVRGTSGLGCVVSIASMDSLNGFLFIGSRENQRRYIWCIESKWNDAVLGDRGTKNEIGVHVQKHLDMPLILGIDRYVETLAHGEKAGSYSPLSLVASNTVNVDGNTLVEAESDSWQGVALSQAQLIKAV